MQRVVQENELRSALASSVLAPSTLVWREGMSGWVPAFTVPELGASDSSIRMHEPPTDGTTDIAPAPKVGVPDELRGPHAPSLDGATGGARAGAPERADAPSLSMGPQAAPNPARSHARAAASDGYGAVPPPPLVVGGKLSPPAHEPGSLADTGRPTPTELLNEKGSPIGPSNGRGPRPAAGQPAAATPFKIGAAPKPATIPPAARPVAKQDVGASSAAKLVSARPATGGGLRKPEIAKPKVEEVTLVAEASDPFKLKAPGDSPSNGTSGGAGAGKEPSRVAASLASRRPVTRTALIPGNEAPKAAGHEPPRPAAGRPSSAPMAASPGAHRSSPSTVPPPAAMVPRRSGSGVPPPPVQVGPRRSPSVAPAARPGATPAPGALGAAASADAKGFRTTAFGGHGGSSGGISLPAAPRIPSLAKPSFNIVENTSTDSTGVLPLSGHYAAEPTQERNEARERLPSFSEPQEQDVQGAQAQAQAQALANAFQQARAPQSPNPSFSDVPAARASSGSAESGGAQRAAAASNPGVPRGHQPSYVEGAPAFAERMPSFPEGAAGLEGAHGGSMPEPRASLRSRPPLAGAAHGGSPHASYPPAPQPLGGALLLGAAAGASRMEVEMPVGPIAPGRLGPSYSDGYSTVPGSEGVPYSAPPPQLGDPTFGEIRTTGALPLVHPKRSLTHGQPLAQGLGESQPPPGYAPLPQGYSNLPPPTSTPPPPGLDPSSLSQPPGKVADPIVVPMSSLFGAGGVLIVMAVMAFFVGRCSVVPGPTAGPARVAFAATPRPRARGAPEPAEAVLDGEATRALGARGAPVGACRRRAIGERRDRRLRA